MQTYVRRLTSEGRGAIAVVRVWGRVAVEVVDRVFRPSRGTSMVDTPPGRLRLGRAGHGEGDEVVAVRLEGAMPIVEIQCHGGAEALRSVVAALETAGALPERDTVAMANCVQFVDPIAAKALDDLSHAPTLRTAEILLDQVHGALGDELERLRAETRLGANTVVEGLDRLIGRGAVGLRLLTGWKVVISGRPNVGKSRLLNAMAGFARAIVDPAPGVTRDVVIVRTAFGGWPVELADTAGIRHTDDPIESLGIARARRERESADLVLLVLDGSKPLLPLDRDLIEANPGALLVINKSDLPSAWDPEVISEDHSACAHVSAERGDGLEALIATAEQRLVPDSPEPGEAVPFRVDQLAALSEVRECLIAGDISRASRRLLAIRLD